MNKEPYTVIDPEICCAYCGKPLTIRIGYSFSDVYCKNDSCGMTNITYASTDLEEIKKQLKKRRNKK